MLRVVANRNRSVKKGKQHCSKIGNTLTTKYTYLIGDQQCSHERKHFRSGFSGNQLQANALSVNVCNCTTFFEPYSLPVHSCFSLCVCLSFFFFFRKYSKYVSSFMFKIFIIYTLVHCCATLYLIRQSPPPGR